MIKEMKLIADAGSTKTAWALCGPGVPPKIFTTRGCNALTAGADEIDDVVRAAMLQIKQGSSAVKSVEYYGAGCATDAVCEKVRDCILHIFPGVAVHVASDLEAAARALFPDGDGIACILGTGSNSCLWIDGSVQSNIPPLGYILGDEGGGAVLGKRLVADALRGMLPSDLRDELAREYEVTKANVLEKVYRSSGANNFLASTVPFLALHRERYEIRHIIIEEFSEFINRNVDLYPESRSFPIGFVGSVALHFRDELHQVCESMGYKVTKILSGPIEALARNCSTNLNTN